MSKLYFLSFFLYLLITVNAKFCDTNNDCGAELVCESGLCTCNVGKIPSNDGSRCLDVSSMGSQCIEDIQCITSIKGSSYCTKDLLCGCTPGYRFFNNECVATQGYGLFCEKNYDCYNGININAFKCDNNKCVCNDGYYLRGDSDCRLSGKANNNTCLINIDCQSDNECCDFLYGPLGKCVLIPNAKNCTIPNNTFYENYEEKIVSRKTKPFNKIDIPCKSNTDCSEIKNSFCPAFKNKCTCKDGYVYNKYSNICVEGLGAKCVNDEDCPIVNTKCNENKICACKDYFIDSKYNDKCLKPARGLNMSCGRDENCYTLGTEAICNKNKCECKKNSKYDEDLMFCHPTENSGNLECENNCEKKPHSSCVQQYCKCDDNYTSDNGKCLPDLGSTCIEALNECVMENAQCTNEKCQCIEGYIKTDNRTCVIEKIDENDNCTADVQCEIYLGTGGICLPDNNTCTCAPNYVRLSVNEKDQCVQQRSFGERCSSNLDCKTILKSGHVVCRNSMCECDYDYHLVTDEYGQRCENGSSIVLLSNLLISLLIGLLLVFN